MSESCCCFLVIEHVPLFFFFFKVAAIKAEVTQRRRDCEDDLIKAEPALEAATAALDTLNKVINTTSIVSENCKQCSVILLNGSFFLLFFLKLVHDS